ncbi:FHA domain-containing protein [Paludisphaera borealis]|uniref:Oxoglutarate dehydrogenase inhibitor n=1 Tax=Paludisphaera borealis TaxID=1387353 RepID=A0A1U7CKA4_9BACT|nr:FHA domain-containing protein [Paludisphaera borealis]APW59313.1 Oxoglutarate dehydrogenase inhibitor [Paludisphaera borealis]
MNYTLQVVRGRTEATSLRLIEGVNSIGRHDDCLIRIRSSQVSRRHCELFENEGRLIIRDLGSSNGTFVNGARIGAQQVLSPGDVITVGGVALRIDADAAPAAKNTPAAGDTAEVEALTAVVDDFEVGLDVSETVFDQPADHLDIIPLDDEPAPEPKKKASAKSKAKEEASQPAEPTPPEPPADDAVAQFLMDLKLDDED